MQASLSQYIEPFEYLDRQRDTKALIHLTLFPLVLFLASVYTVYSKCCSEDFEFYQKFNKKFIHDAVTLHTS